MRRQLQQRAFARIGAQRIDLPGRQKAGQEDEA
jgi:hypothetical protein